MKKTTVKASADIAFIKYWGKKNEMLRLPENGSISMKVSGLDTTTTVEFDSSLSSDQVIIDTQKQKKEIARVVKHLDRIRKLADVKTFARVESQNSFPRASGLSSSGSGFAALTLAGTKALSLNLSEKELSILARQGSGTACRCVCGGFVEWLDGITSDTSYSQTIFPANHWDLRDVVVIVDQGQKKVSTTEGHTTAQSSPFFAERQNRIKNKIEQVKKYIGQKNFTKLGEIIEAEALEFHSILLTSQPGLIAWYPGTVQVMLAVQNFRKQGVECYFTINTGFNIHVLTLPESEEKVKDHMESLSLVQNTIVGKVGGEPQVLSKHLF